MPGSLALHIKLISLETSVERLWSFASLAMIAAVVVVGLYFWRRDRVTPTTKTIAVLPFKSPVEENRDEALELGMTDALISKLSEAEELTVRPLSAVRRYDSPDQDSVAAGPQLNVEAVLDGSLQSAGDRIRVMARLVRVSDGKQLWASQIDEKYTDIFKVQDSISERVATSLKIRLANKQQRGLNNYLPGGGPARAAPPQPLQLKSLCLCERSGC